MEDSVDFWREMFTSGTDIFSLYIFMSIPSFNSCLSTTVACERIMKTSMEGYTILLFCSPLFFILIMSTATDTITVSQSIRDGQTIASAAGSFELGFFSSGNSMKRYLGIWYKKISDKTVVWVANREIPLKDSSGVLKVTNQGILILINDNETVIWSTNSSRLAVNPVAQLLESGNLVVRDADNYKLENYLWQSFDYPCDVLLPGMKLGRNTVSGLEWYLSSWKSTDDPSKGSFTALIDPHGFPQLVIRTGSVEQFRFNFINGASNIKPNSIYKVRFILNETEVSYTYDLINSSVVTRLVLNQSGILQRYIWIDRTQEWNLYLTVQTDSCDNYARCGAYGSCNVGNSPRCGCLKGFEPKFPKDWEIGDWSNGCVRRTPLNCPSGDGFINYSGVKLPDSRYSWFNESLTLEECKLACLKNCSCMAYSSLDLRVGRSGCLLWFGDIIDMREFPDNGQEIYIRMASSEIASCLGQVGSDGKKRVRIICSSVLAGMLLLGLVLTLYIWKKQLNRQGEGGNPERGYTTEDLELPLFDLATVANSTNNFSINNKLGEGGFGPVYKGVLEDGQEIAVKRLSTNSRQGPSEFKNEVIHIAKLQHRNLVKMLGCCIQGDEKLLIYEFMPNKSLDFFIFDHTQSNQLDWPKRFHIINGIAQGLLYLHRDSRLRIIHRDLKASNILLDNEMNPKISDFGLARSFGGSETEARTNKVVGTYGYMSPEYAVDGHYSVKSDVFSFGVLLLEIVSGKRNRGFFHPDHHLNLTGHAWRLHIEGRSLELIESSIGDSCNLSEVLRSIHVGLLCVQRSLEDRPGMALVVLMLAGEGALPQPQQPGFYNERNLGEVNSSSGKCETCSTNEITVTVLEGR